MCVFLCGLVSDKRYAYYYLDLFIYAGLLKRKSKLSNINKCHILLVMGLRRRVQFSVPTIKMVMEDSKVVNELQKKVMEF